MISKRDLLSGLGATVFGVGAAILGANIYRTATDSLVAKTAATCMAIDSNSFVQTAKPLARFLFPRATPLAEGTQAAICDVAIRLHSYSLLYALGFSLVAAGAIAFGFSRCFSLKSNQAS
jgi:hypothetical protein